MKNMHLEGVTVLELKLDFGFEEFRKHYDQRNSDNPAIPSLTASVKRKWYDEKTRLTYPVDTAVSSKLRFYVTGCRDEDTHGQRFILNAVALYALEMEVGPIVKGPTKGDQPTFSHDKSGIQKWTSLQLFVDLAAGRGAIISYANQGGIPIDLALPDDLPFDPDPLIIPDCQRQNISEKDLFQPQQPNPDSSPEEQD